MADLGYVNVQNPLQTPPGILQTAEQAIALRNQLNQNLLFKAQVAAGQAYQGAIDPTTGAVNQNAFMRGLGANPAAGPVAQSAGGASLAQGGQQIANLRAQAALGQGYSGAIKGALSASGPPPVGVNGEPLAPTDAKSVAYRSRQLALIHNLVQTGAIPPDVAATVVGSNSLPDGTPLTDVLAQAGAIAAGGSTEAAMFGTPTPVNTGGATKFNSVNQVSGQVTPMGGPAAVIPNTPSPEALISRVPVVQGGVPGSVALGSMGGGFQQNQLTPEQAAAQAQAGAQEGGEAATLQTAANGAPARKAILGEMEGALGDFTTGPGAKKWGGIFSEANRLFPGANLDTTGVAAQEEFTKLSLQMAQQQFGGLGGTGTDAKLNSAMQTNPQDALSKLGNKNIIALLKGNEDALSAKRSAWQQWQAAGHGPETSNQFSDQFNKIYDPRVFQFRYMSPDQRASTLNGMDRGEKAKFLRVQDVAKQLGWVQ